MRNVISHNYGRLDSGHIWHAATYELTPLAKICRLELARAS